MERFLVRNQGPKPDPGIVDRAAKAKKHRKIEKIVEATLYKRRKLETRSAFLHEHPIEKPTIGHTNAVTAGALNDFPKGEHGGINSIAMSRRARAAAGDVPGVQARAQQYRPAGNVLRVHPPGEGDYGFMEIAGAHPARLAKTERRPDKGWKDPRPAYEGHVRYFKASNRPGHDAQWDEVAQGEHLRDAEHQRVIEHPRQPLAPGLVAQRMRAIERK